jgi:hypothetical protein
MNTLIPYTQISYTNQEQSLLNSRAYRIEYFTTIPCGYSLLILLPLQMPVLSGGVPFGMTTSIECVRSTETPSLIFGLRKEELLTMTCTECQFISMPSGSLTARWTLECFQPNGNRLLVSAGSLLKSSLTTRVETPWHMC